MEDLKYRLLNYLREFRSEKVIFKLNDALDKLKVSRRELEEALFALEDEGYLTVLKIPPSDTVVSRLKTKLNELDASLLMGVVTESEYNEKWRMIVGITNHDAIKDWGPLPSQNLRELLKALRTACDHLYKLREEKDKVDDKVYNELLKVYISNLLKLGNVLRNYAKALITTLKIIRDELEGLRIKSEVLELDSRTRGVDHRYELEDLERKTRELLKRIQQLISKAGFLQQPDTGVGESEALLKRLAGELSHAEKSLQIIRARALIEGEEKYRVEIDRLDRMIQELKERVEALRSELKPPEAGENLLKELESLQIRLRNLPKDGLSEEMQLSVIETLDLIGAALRVLQKLANEMQEGGQALYSIPKFLAILAELPS
ncbi:MAG: hypothetical protein QXW23_05730 [Thermofilaceae archaeon]